MGILGGCCKCAVAFGIVPVSVIIAVLLETPAVLELDAASAAGAAPAAAAAARQGREEEGGGAGGGPAAGGGEEDFGRPVSGGMGSGGMFDRIAFVYDSTNKWMSLGLDQFWRKTLVQDCLRLEANDRVLDLATGTADVSVLAGARLRELRGGAAAEEASSSGGPAVLGVDPSSEMLRRGVAKVEGVGLAGVVRLVKGDAQDLTSVRGIDAEGRLAAPTAGVESDSIDKISMAFGIRNVPNRALAFREMRRVLRKREASRVCILEFSLPDGEKLLSGIARAFITQVVPIIGRIATLNAGSEEYEYLERSILKFPKPLDFAASMAREGLPVRSITSFAYGAVHLYAAAPAVQLMLLNPEVTKVGFACSHKDAAKLASSGIVVTRGSMVDVQSRCAVVLGVSKNAGRSLSLKRAAHELLGFMLEKDKRHSCSDWSAASLTPDQVRYAALDAWVALRLFYRTV